MAEITNNNTISDMELFKKLMRFMRKTRMKTGRGLPGMGGMRGMGGFPWMRGGNDGPGPEGRCRRRPDDRGPFPGMQGRPEQFGKCDRPDGPPARHGMRPPLSREHLLVIISRSPDGIRQKALAEDVGIGASSVSELVNKLEITGYIERKTDPADKRATLLFLTEKGQARAAEIEDERAELFKGIFDGLTDDEKKTLSDLLDKLLAAADEQ